MNFKKLACPPDKGREFQSSKMGKISVKRVCIIFTMTYTKTFEIACKRNALSYIFYLPKNILTDKTDRLCEEHTLYFNFRFCN